MSRAIAGLSVTEHIRLQTPQVGDVWRLRHGSAKARIDKVTANRVYYYRTFNGIEHRSWLSRRVFHSLYVKVTGARYEY